MIRFRVSIVVFIIISISCASIQILPFDTAEERASSSLIILGNPPGTYPVSIVDLPDLLAFAEDENPAVRQMALFQLQQLKTVTFLDDILPLIFDDDISVSRNAEELFLKNKDKAVPIFRNILDHKDPLLRYKALEFLVKLDDKESLTLIIELFDDDEEKVVDRAIIAAAELGSVNDRILFDTLLRQEVSLRVGVVKTFNKIGDPAVLGTLLPYFYDPELKVQNAVKFAFVDFGDQSIPYLLNVLNNPVPQTQISILGLLEALQNKDSIPHIIALFNNDNERVKAAAINTTSTFGDEALDFLGESLNRSDEDIVITSIRLLGNIDKRESLNYLVPYLDHENENIRNAVFDSLLLFEDMAGDQFLRIIDRRREELYQSAIKGLMILQDRRLILDDKTSLYNRNNRGKVLLLHSSIDNLITFLNNIDISGLLVRDFTLLKKINQAAILLISSEQDIRRSGSRYTTFYISKNDFKKKAKEAQRLSFTYMHNYMESKNPEDLETAKKQQEFSTLFNKAAEELDEQLEYYVGSTEEEQNLIVTFEKSREDIRNLYESVSLNRKKLADDILSVYGLSYNRVISGDFIY